MSTASRYSKSFGSSWISLSLSLVAIYGPLVLTLCTFHQLVKDPVEVLVGTLPLVVLATCLPSLASSASSLASIIHDLGALVLLYIPVTYAIVILMGAPCTTHVAQTVLFSSHLATMLFLQAVAHLGLDKNKWLPLLPFISEETQSQPQRPAFSKSIGGTGLEGIVWGTLAGAYLGAVPIPLDWDREWQKWPVTVHVGACIGLAMGGTMQIVYDAYRRSSKVNARGPSSKKTE